MLPSKYPAERVRRILIIEDDEMIAGIYKKRFESAGFDVDMETDGAHGYYRIFKNCPDIVLLDLMLPGMDGPAIIRKFRAQRKFAELPIIVFTNAYRTEIGREAETAGATRIFNKATVTPQEIVSAAISLLSGKSGPSDAPNPAEVEPVASETGRHNMIGESPFHSGPSKEPASPVPPVNVAENFTPGVENFKPPLVAKSESSPSNQPAQEPVQPATTPGSQPISESAFQSLVLESFVQKSDPWIYALRQILRTLQVDGRRKPEVDAFVDMARISHAVSSNAAIAGLHYLAHISAALEAMAWELFDHPSKFSAPTRQTAAKAIDMIARLATCGSSCQLKEFSRFHALVVDDDGIARKMIAKSLDMAKLSYVATGRPALAMELLSENTFDLIILDVKMEEMSGFEFCTAMRQMPQHNHTRVIFVSGLTDFQSKLSSTQAGGNEFIVKPFTPMELALKALLHMVTAQLDQQVGSEEGAEPTNG